LRGAAAWFAQVFCSNRERSRRGMFALNRFRNSYQTNEVNATAFPEKRLNTDEA
jgi:hypothetical protein